VGIQFACRGYPMKIARLIIRPLLPVIALGVLLPGCGSNADNPAGPSAPPTSGSTVSYTAVGASDTMGWGSSAWCVPFTDCPNGTGYVPTIIRRLKAMGTTVTSSNLGIPGAFIGSDFESLASQYGAGFPVIPGYDLKGNFIDSEVGFVPRDSTVVTIFAGGNDVRTVARALDLGAGGSNPQGFLDQQVTNFKNDYNAVLRTIKERAPQSRIVVANLPNFAAMPYTAGYSSTQRLWVQKISVGFSTQVINTLTSQGVAVVDLMCGSQFTNRANFSSDGFHPNDAGYAALADAFMSAITSASYPAPSGSCGNMTIVK
jgi:lysophospholipase L1-like esterase